MKNLSLIFCLISFLTISAQDHFSGITTSKKVTLLNAGVNPAELSNLTSKYDANLFSLSINASNNKIGFSDIVNGNNIEDLILKGDEPVNMRIDAEIYGPGFAMRLNKWAFGVSTKAYAKLNLVDVDTKLGESINNSLNSFIPGSTTTLNNNYNQRVNGTSWGEVGFSVTRNLFENEKHKFSVGTTLKLLFPGSYTNFGLDKFNGEIKVNELEGEAYLNNANAKLNIAYSGNLNGDFANFNEYTKSMFGQLNGVALDLGANYQLKDKENEGYKLNTGVSIRNIGGMSFDNPGNSSTDYSLKIQSTFANPNGLAMSQFQNSNDLEDVENTLQNDGYLTKTESTNSIDVKLPTVFSLYADLKVYSKFYMTLYTQQKLGSDNKDNQITTQNVVSVIPRFSLDNFEVYSAWSANEISGTTGGLGFRIYGFYLGSSSIVTALVSDTKQADFYMGFRFGLK
jgi:hypothetical protein